MVLHGPGDRGRCRVGIGQAQEHGVRTADIPVVVVAFYGDRRGVWNTDKNLNISVLTTTRLDIHSYQTNWKIVSLQICDWLIDWLILNTETLNCYLNNNNTSKNFFWLILSYMFLCLALYYLQQGTHFLVKKKKFKNVKTF